MDFRENQHFKVIVVQDLYHNFYTHSIAGSKLEGKLIGPSIELKLADTTKPLEIVKNGSIEPTAKNSNKKKNTENTRPS